MQEGILSTGDQELWWGIQTQSAEMPSVTSRKPSASAFSQQTLPDWSPTIGEREWIQIYYFLASLMFILGSVLCAEYVQHREWSYVYDGENADFTECQITSANKGKICQIGFNFDEDVSGPLYVYYGLTNFHQNNRRYTKSVMTDMLTGSTVIDEDSADLYCYPLQYNGTRMLYPCGLQANTYFNDGFVVSHATTLSSELDKDGITFDAEDSKFTQVDGFMYASYTAGQTCQDVLGTGVTESDCGTYTDSGTSYYYYYPNSDTYQYLHETFPQINPLRGVTDESFVVWMRLSSFANFRKQIGKIDTDVNAGESLQFAVANNFDVSSFSGSKSLIITTSPSAEIHLKGFWITCFLLGALFFTSGTSLLLKDQWETLRDYLHGVYASI